MQSSQLTYVDEVPFHKGELADPRLMSGLQIKQAIALAESILLAPEALVGGFADTGLFRDRNPGDRNGPGQLAVHIRLGVDGTPIPPDWLLATNDFDVPSSFYPIRWFAVSPADGCAAPRLNQSTRWG